MNEVLTVEEVEARYPDEWVLLADPVERKGPTLIRGRVVFHSPDRDALHQCEMELRLKNSAVLFTGRNSDRIFNL